MLKTKIIRKFRCSYAELLEQSLEKQEFLTRDSADLLSRGITAARLTTYQALIATYLAESPDYVYRGIITSAAQAKNTTRKEMEDIMQEVAGIARITFKNDEGTYNTFGYTDIGSLSDYELAARAIIFAERTTLNKIAMTAKGLTTDMLTDLEDLIAGFTPGKKGVAEKKSNRRKKTSDRIIAGNALYTELVLLCEIARLFNKSRDAAKYRDYVIFGNKKSGQLRNGSLAPGTIRTRNISALKPGKAFHLAVEGDATLEFYFSQTDGGGPATVFLSVDPYGSLDTTARDLGYDPSIGATYFTIRNPDASKTSAYRVKVK